MSKSGVFARCLSCLLQPHSHSRLPYRVKPKTILIITLDKSISTYLIRLNQKSLTVVQTGLEGMKKVFLNIEFLEITLN